MENLGRVLMAFGSGLFILGAVLSFGPRLPLLGRLPGDIVVQKPNVSFFMPITTCLLISALASLILWFMGKMR